MLLGNVDVEAVLAYLRPRRFSDEADYASVLNSAAFRRCLDDVIDSGPGEARVAEMECRDPICPAETTLDRADSAQALMWGAGPGVFPQPVGG